MNCSSFHKLLLKIVIVFSYHLFFLILLTTQFIHAQVGALNPCTDLENANSKNDFYIKLEAWHEAIELQSHAEDEYYFTTHSGYSVRPSCFTPGINKIKFLYYPTGLVVKELKIHTNYKYSSYWNELKKSNIDDVDEYVPVLTEYGIYMLVPKNHLTKLEEGKLYLFVDSGHDIGYCKGTGCVDEVDMTEQDPALKLTTGTSKNAARYGEITDVNEEADGCKVYKFDPAEGGKKLPVSGVLYLYDCWNGFINRDKDRMKIKVFSAKSIEEKFKIGPTGIQIQFNWNWNMRDITDLAQGINKTIYNGKRDCGNIDNKELYIHTGYFGQFLKVNSQRHDLLFNIMNLNKNRLNLSHYSLVDVNHFSSKFGIVDLYPCSVSGWSHRNGLVYILNSKPYDKYIVIEVRQVAKKYKELYGNKSYNPSNNRKDLINGFFYKICDSNGYYNLRDSLSEVLKDNSDMNNILPNNKVAKNKFLDYITHVIMASMTKLIDCY